MAYDYSDDVAFALDMVAEFGRSVSFVQINTMVDSKPLHGVIEPPVTVHGVMAAFVEPSSVIRLGASTDRQFGLWVDSTQIAIVGPDPLYDFTTFNTVTDDDGSTWKITHVEKFKPGDTTLLYYVGVKR